MAQKTAPVVHPLLDLEYLNDAAECLRTLAHPHRLRMVQLLLQGRFNVGELADACHIPSHMASEHLRLMQRCGLLRSARRSLYFLRDRSAASGGNHGLYRVSPSRAISKGIIVMRVWIGWIFSRTNVDTLVVVGLLLTAFVLQAFVLPGLGLST